MPPRPPHDWANIDVIAEEHAAAPLLHQWLTREKNTVDAPTPARRAITALALRHKLAYRARLKALNLMLEALETQNIPVILLKGAALAETVYADPALRPMRDVDILVSKQQAQAAAQCLTRIGFVQDETHLSRYMQDHHHLPNTAITIDGMKISVEVHHDAIAADVDDSIATDNLSAGPLSLTLSSGRAARCLNHTDMLRHLCRHSFEPAAEIRLIHLFDIIAWASHYASDIDWDKIRAQYPRIIAVIRCAHCVLPLPQQLTKHIAPPARRPARAGEGMRPLSAIVNSGNPPHRTLAELLNPPAWWMHGYYGIDPDRSLAACRLVKHPANLMRWLGRRFLWRIKTTKTRRIRI